MSELTEVRERLARIETKLDIIADQRREIHADLDEHDDRLRKVEGSQSHNDGRSSVIGAIAGAAMGAAFAWLSRHIPSLGGP